MPDLTDVLSRLKLEHSGAPVAPVVHKPVCPKCGGVGWYGYDVSIDDPRFGKSFVCECTAPKLYASRSGLVESELALTWDAVRDLNNATEAVWAVRETMARGYGWVFLWGPPGLAKSLVLQIAVAEAIRAVREACYVRMIEIIDNLRASFGDKATGEEERRLDRWASTPLLAIDEFDKLNETEYASSKRFLLMDKRYQDALRERTITIMASNSDPATYDGYLSSRIFDGRFTVVKMTGEDVRPFMERGK